VLVGEVSVTGAAQLGTLTRNLDRARRRRPPLVVAAQLGGEEVAVQGVGPRSQESTHTPAAAQAQPRAAGRHLRRLGVDAVLAPSADPGSGRRTQGAARLSDDPGEATSLGGGAAVGGWYDTRRSQS
jgi:hypothetical protein